MTYVLFRVGEHGILRELGDHLTDCRHEDVLDALNELYEMEKNWPEENYIMLQVHIAYLNVKPSKK
jgi:hypothetical protein